MTDQVACVTVTRLAAGRDGDPFETVAIPYDTALGPLRQTRAVAARDIRFCWFPAGYAATSRTVAGPHLIVVQDGAAALEAPGGEVRAFRPGDLLEVAGEIGRGYALRALDGLPFRAAVIELEGEPGQGDEAPAGPPSGRALPYLRNVTGDDDRSHFEDGALPYFVAGGGSLATARIPLVRYQYVLALGDLSYDFHNAPQRQIVLPLTGGTEGENGDGSRRRVAPGGLYFGEDTTGQGHITRAVDGRVRFSIFAHLA